MNKRNKLSRIFVDKTISTKNQRSGLVSSKVPSVKCVCVCIYIIAYYFNNPIYVELFMRFIKKT